jgi:hypothetical protein
MPGFGFTDRELTWIRFNAPRDLGIRHRYAPEWFQPLMDDGSSAYVETLRNPAPVASQDGSTPTGSNLVLQRISPALTPQETGNQGLSTPLIIALIIAGVIILK